MTSPFDGSIWTPTKKLGWWIKGQREALAYRLAPWVGERAVAAEETAARYRSALEQIAAHVYTSDGMPKPLKFSAQSVLAEVARDVLAAFDERQGT